VGGWGCHLELSAGLKGGGGGELCQAFASKAMEKCIQSFSDRLAISQHGKQAARQRPEDSFTSPRLAFGDVLGRKPAYQKKKTRSQEERGTSFEQSSSMTACSVETDVQRRGHSAAFLSGQGTGKQDGNRKSRSASPALSAMKSKVAFIKASHSGDISAMQRLVSVNRIRVSEEKMALHFAADANQCHVVQYLLQSGVDVDSRDSKNRTALMYAAYQGSLDAIAVLLESNADVEVQDNFGSTPLMYAASGGDAECCELLVNNGANLEEKNTNGFSCLIYAVESGRSSTLQKLLSLGANPEAQSGDGASALHWAAKKGNAECCKIIISHGVGVDTKNNKSVTPLMYAADSCSESGSNVATLGLLVDAGADIFARDEDASNPLMYAAHSGSIGNIKFLLGRGADPSIANKYGTTPLMYAAHYGHTGAVAAFLSHDAKLQLMRDVHGMSAADWAKQAGKDDVVRLLDQLSQFPLDWSPSTHALHPEHFKEKVRTVLLASNAKSCLLQKLPNDILVKVIGKLARAELWPCTI